ncbi:VCBS domain-containing protein [Aeromonas caviae]|uniref:VCBS domain-containing protein n=2 Tax=Aeromonas caviae TaxID=648 RepID=UPI00187D2B10|nr:VCBS domain-containing protein [Aeromonas caviae]
MLGADGKWTYSADNGQAAIQGLKAGETLTDTLTVTNADGKTTTTVTITINGTDDVPTLTPDVGSVTEDRNVQPGNLLQASGTLAPAPAATPVKTSSSRARSTASMASWCWARMASGRTAPTTARRRSRG